METPNQGTWPAIFESVEDISHELPLTVQVKALRDLSLQYEQIIDQLRGASENQRATIDVLAFDNTTKQQQITELLELNRRDAATGLLNSVAWRNEIDTLIAKREPFGVWGFDLRFFKIVNDTYGHHTGDILLGKFAELMHDKMQREDDRFIDTTTPVTTASRTGGDEFGFTTGLAGEHPRGADLHNNMNKQHAYIAQLVTEFVAGLPQEIRDLGFDIAIGPALWDPRRPTDRDTLLAQADEAMYEHKSEQLVPLSTEQLAVLIRVEQDLANAQINRAYVGRYADSIV